MGIWTCDYFAYYHSMTLHFFSDKAQLPDQSSSTEIPSDLALMSTLYLSWITLVVSWEVRLFHNTGTSKMKSPLIVCRLTPAGWLPFSVISSKIRSHSSALLRDASCMFFQPYDSNSLFHSSSCIYNSPSGTSVFWREQAFCLISLATLAPKLRLLVK